MRRTFQHDLDDGRTIEVIVRHSIWVSSTLYDKEGYFLSHTEERAYHGYSDQGLVKEELQRHV